VKGKKKKKKKKPKKEKRTTLGLVVVFFPTFFRQVNTDGVFFSGFLFVLGGKVKGQIQLSRSHKLILVK
jgi:hypothetical protein